MIKRFIIAGLTCAALFMLALPAPAQEQPIKFGFPIPLTGEIPKVGESSKYAAEMFREEVNAAGGLEVAGKKYPLEFIYEDN